MTIALDTALQNPRLLGAHRVRPTHGGRGWLF
jgi:hypothetical protein